MIRLFFTSLLIVIASATIAQNTYWQQHVDYKINVSLDDKANTLTGNEEIVYKNNSPESLDFIWFHIWPNAYKNDSTALFQQIKNDPTSEEDLTKVKYGYITGLNFKVNGKAVKTEAHSNPHYIDIIKVLLPEALKPGESVSISTNFKVQLPTYFSRSGYADGQFMATQWYPKPAVYDKNGWNEFPYLNMGEFYSDFSNFKVSITLPASYVVGATGKLQNTEELKQYKIIGTKNTAIRTGKPVLYKNKSTKKTLTYTAENVPDFAWFAEKNIVIQYDTIKLASGKIVDAFTFFKNVPETIWNNSIDYAKDATKSYSSWVGEYEYPTVQVFEGPKNNSSGGMEYPMITLITAPNANKELLDGVITHEIGHNWFMSMLGSNERLHAWQDEGLNTYYEFLYEAEKYRANSVMGEHIPQQIKDLPVDQFREALYRAMEQIPMQSAIDIPSADFKTSQDYGLISYVKAVLWIYELEKKVGRNGIDKAMQQYFKDWSGKHPQPEDMKASFEKALGMNLDNWFQQLKQEGSF